MKSQKAIFRKMAETAHRASSTVAADSEHSIAIHSISMAGYLTTVPAFVCIELPAREASSFCDFFKLTLCNFTTYFSFLTDVILYFVRCALANLCPSMIHFYLVDLVSVANWRSDKFLLTLSVVFSGIPWNPPRGRVGEGGRELLNGSDHILPEVEASVVFFMWGEWGGLCREAPPPPPQAIWNLQRPTCYKL